LDGNDRIALLLLPEFTENASSEIKVVPMAMDLEAVEERNTVRMTVINAMVCASSDAQCPTHFDVADVSGDYTSDPLILIENLGYGQISKAEVLDKGEYTLGIYQAGSIEQAREAAEAEDTDPEFSAYTQLNDENLDPNTSFMWIVTSRVGNQINPPQHILIKDMNEPSFGGPQAIGYSLMTDYLLPLQVVGVLLLVAMVGVIVMTKELEPKSKRPRKERRMANVAGNPTISDYLKALKEGQAAPTTEAKKSKEN
jgi:hypothetical protein